MTTNGEESRILAMSDEESRAMARNDEEFQVLAMNDDEESRLLIDLFDGSPESYVRLGVPLYRAALEGNWDKAEVILCNNSKLAKARITKCGETALHIAAATKCDDFVRNLVGIMTEKDLAMKNVKGNTALHFAAAAGSVEIAKLMVEKNESLPLERGSDGMTPLLMATLLGQWEMVVYLMGKTDFDRLRPHEIFDQLINAIKSEFYDIAKLVLEKYPILAAYQDVDLKTPLHFLSQKRLKSRSNQESMWSKWTSFLFQGRDNHDTQRDGLELVEKLWLEIIMKKTYQEMAALFGSPSVLLFEAAAIGNIGFIEVLIGFYPDLIWKINTDGITMFHIAISKRQVDVYNLIYEIGAVKDLLATYTDENMNSMLHMAAMMPPPGSLDDVLGAALQMQRELLWYKEVESVVPAQFIGSKNIDDKKPWSLFIDHHEPLRKDGEKWMKTTANSCSVVAALIATIAFTAAFTVPGGNNQDKGTPIFQKSATFVVFAIADAISLFSSSLAIFMFLGILTSRYSPEDFLKSLPMKMMAGLTSLFISISSMMVAFGSTFFLIFRSGGHLWIFIPIGVTILVAVPVILFAFQQSTLLIDIYRSTYQSRYLFKPNKHKIFNAHDQEWSLPQESPSEPALNQIVQPREVFSIEQL